MDIEDVFIKTGEFGKFQKKVFISCLLLAFNAGTIMMQNIFAGAVPSKKICLNEPEFDACDECCTKIGYPDEKYKSFATEVLYIIFIQFLCFYVIGSFSR